MFNGRLIPVPEKCRVIEYMDSVIIRWRWFNLSVVPLIFFCAAWDSFLVFWYMMAFTQETPWIAIVFPVAHVAVGIGLTYFVLATLLNATDVMISSGSLRIRHYPLPWFGNRYIDRMDIRQLYVRRSDSTRNGAVTYELFMIDQLNNGKRLLSGISDRDLARFLEQKIEQKLGIKNEPVFGEEGD